MSFEYEYKFLFNKKLTPKKFRQKLKDMGAEHIKPILFSTTIFKLPQNDKLFIRLRNEGFKKTFTIKYNNETMFKNEFEIIINDINTAQDMLILLGCTVKNSNEKLREVFNFSDVQVVFDYYPGLPPFFEIEAKSESILNDFCKQFNLDPVNHIKYDIYAKEYGLESNRKVDDDLTFEKANNKFLHIITKNKSKFIKILKKEIDYINKHNLKKQ